jgi:hypothetical protein
VNNDNIVGEEIKEGISVGSKVFYANKKVMFSKLLKKILKCSSIKA